MFTSHVPKDKSSLLKSSDNSVFKGNEMRSDR